MLGSLRVGALPFFLLTAALAAQTSVQVNTAVPTGGPGVKVNVDVNFPAAPVTATLQFALLHGGVWYFTEVLAAVRGPGQNFTPIFPVTPVVGDQISAIVNASNGDSATSTKVL